MAEDAGCTGVIAQLRFPGSGGRFSRHGLLRHGMRGSGRARFIRIDTGAGVDLFGVPADAPMRLLLARVSWPVLPGHAGLIRRCGKAGCAEHGDGLAVIQVR